MSTFERNPQTEADVHRLMQTFGDILPDGRTITHAEIEAALMMPRALPRYRTVVAKWRKQLQDERCVYLDGLSAHGEGFVALTPDEMIRFSNRAVQSAGRKVKRALEVASLPSDDDLSPSLRTYRERLVFVIERIVRENRAMLREVGRGLKPPAQLPRRATPAMA